MQFKLASKFKPTGDQPKAIKQLVDNLKAGVKDQVLLGVTGSGKTYTLANVIEKIQKPTLIISPNKTLAAQLYQEFKEFFPNNAVHYFVSYYDYYQPEAYIPQSDTYIEKDAKINEEIDRLRHAAVQDVTTRKDVIVVASVSCIYNIGSPENYENISLEIKLKQGIKRKDFLILLNNLQYQRNDIDFKPGTFRARGDIVEIYIVTGEKILRIEFNGDVIDKISESAPGLAKPYKTQGVPCPERYRLFPAHFWVTPQDKVNIAINNIRLELEQRLKALKKDKKLLEAERLEQKTNYDLEMLKETGWCHGIENYSSHMEFRKPGQAPFSLVDYFNYFNPEGFLMFIDESHISISQIRAMSVQDRIRKQTLIDFGFRFPSAVDNRPLTFAEFEKRQRPARNAYGLPASATPEALQAGIADAGGQTIYVSATPADFERKKAGSKIIEQLIRPTGLLEPSIEIRKTNPPAGGQIKNLIEEIRKQIEKKQRTLVVTITKRLAEEISDYLTERGVKTQYLHSEVKTMERPKILKNLREGKYDVLVGINLLREGIDLPEVSLVAILDADKEGFLRNETTLIQTMGRAARHVNGRIILYADKETISIKNAVKEINRRRKIQQIYNRKNGITPKTIVSDIREWRFSKKEDVEHPLGPEFWMVRDKKLLPSTIFQGGKLDKQTIQKMVLGLEKEMETAAKNLDFERAAEIRDLIKKTHPVK